MAPRDTKLLVSISTLLITTAVLGFRWQEPLFSVPAVFALFILAIWTGRPTPAVSLGVALLFLYPATQTGWLYARGAHVAARSTVAIADTGWPVTTDLVRGFTETPGIHFLALVLSRLSDFAILPTTTGRPLVGTVVGVWCGAVALLFIGVLIRRYRATTARSTDLPPVAYLVLPVIAWTPFFQQRVVFARRTLGIALFAIVLYLLYRFLRTPRLKYKVFLLAITLTIIPVHHLTAFLTIVVLFLSGVWIRTSPLSSIFTERKRTTQIQFHQPHLVGVTLITTVVFVFWQFLATTGGTLFFFVVGGGASISKKMAAVLSFLGPTQQPTGLPPVTPNWLVRYQGFFGVWMFLATAGILTVLTAYAVGRDDIDEGWVGFALLIGVIFGAITLASWFTGLGSRTRIATFFVLVSGWVTPFGGWLIVRNSRFSQAIVTKAIVGLLVVLGVALVPPYVVGIGEPSYRGGVTDQRFPASYYAGGEFINKATAPDQLIVGDENAEHILIATSGRRVHNSPSPVISGKKPEGSIVMLFAYNNQYYFGSTAILGRYRTSPDLPLNISAKTSKAYSNGEAIVFV